MAEQDTGTESPKESPTPSEKTIILEADDKSLGDSESTKAPAKDGDGDGETAKKQNDATGSKDGEPDKDGGKKEGDGESTPSYDDLKIQDGMEVDETAFASFKELATSLNDGKGLSPKDAQKLVDFRAEMVKGQHDQWESTFSEWRGEIHADKEIGGDNFVKKTIPNVLNAAETYGDPEMIKLLKTNRLYGENPHLIRMLNKVGETLAEDKISRGKATSPKRDPVDILYPEKKEA